MYNAFHTAIASLTSSYMIWFHAECFTQQHSGWANVTSSHFFIVQKGDGGYMCMWNYTNTKCHAWVLLMQFIVLASICGVLCSGFV